MNCWTHYWANNTVEFTQELAEADPGERMLGHTASNMFGRLDGKFDINDAKVQPDDLVYCISNVKGRVLLLGRLEVDEVVDQRTAERKLGSTNLWRAKYHLLARDGTVMPMRFDLLLPAAEARMIEFISGGKIVHPLFTNGRADQQTFRSVRKITHTTAHMFDKALLQSPKRSRPK